MTTNGAAAAINRLHHIQGHTIASYAVNEHLEGTPYIMIHGIASSHYFWRVGTLPLVRDRRRWYALSLPGHAPAKFADGFTTEQLTPSLIVELLYGAIKELVGDERFILVGHSTGGFAALAIAAQHPEQVAGLISIAGFARGVWGGPLRQMQMFARAGKLGQRITKFQLRAVSVTRGVYQFTTGFYANDRRAMNQNPYIDATFDYIYPLARRLDPNDVIHYFIKMPETDIISWIPSIRAPTLIITGDADHIIPPHEATHIAHHIKGAELVQIAGAGHMVMAERMESYNAALEDWITRHGF